MNYKFANLLGAPYRGGNVILHGSELLSPVGNRVSQVSCHNSAFLTAHSSQLQPVTAAAAAAAPATLQDNWRQQLDAHGHAALLSEHISSCLSAHSSC